MYTKTKLIPTKVIYEKTPRPEDSYQLFQIMMGIYCDKNDKK